MKKLTFFSLSVLCILACACRESALSDVEIDDPSLLKVYGTVGQLCNLDSIVTEADYVIVRIKDKTDHSVDLKKGSVQCNGIEMVSRTDLIGPYYTVPQEIVIVKSDTTYNFIIELADGGQYTGNVSIDNKHLKSLSVQSSWNWTTTDSLTIFWNDVDDAYTTWLYWTITFKDGVDHTDITSLGSYNVSDVNSYSFPSSFFTNTSDELMMEKLNIHLSSEKEGTLDSRFRSGYIKCKFDYSKDITVH